MFKKKIEGSLVLAFSEHESCSVMNDFRTCSSLFYSVATNADHWKLDLTSVVKPYVQIFESKWFNNHDWLRKNNDLKELD